MTLTEIKKHVSAMRLDVLDMKKQSNEPEVQKLASEFMGCYKALKLWLDAPADEVYGNKIDKVQQPYDELKNWYDALKESFQRNAAPDVPIMLSALRTYKKAALALVEREYMKDNRAFAQKVRDFAAAIPARNAAWQELDPDQVVQLYGKLMQDYVDINEWSKKVYQLRVERLLDEETPKIKEEAEQPSPTPTSEPESTEQAAGNRGGYRPGAGRKKIGQPIKVTITLEPEEWERIDELIAEGHAASRADYFRQLHLSQSDGQMRIDFSTLKGGD